MYSLDDTLEALLGESSGSGINGMYHCPLHTDNTPSLSAHREEGLWRCHSCGAAGDLNKLANIVGKDLGEDFYLDRMIASTKVLPAVEQDFTELATRLYDRGLSDRGNIAIRNFLNKRGIDNDARHHFRLGWDGFRISFPYFTSEERKHGKVVAIKYRDQQGNKSYETGGRRAIYNVEEVRGAGEVIICEGESDTLLAWSRNRSGPRVCGIPGASVSIRTAEYWALDFLWANKIYVALDADDAGDAGSDTLIRALGERAIRVRPDPDTDGHDLVDHYKKHGSLPQWN